jgi:peptide/nickel transport system permease protein
MLSFLAKRLLATLPVLLVVAVAVFMIVRLTPATRRRDRRQQRHQRGPGPHPPQLGLNEPLWQQFRLWGGAVLQGDLGHSFFMNKPVTELIAQRMEPTLALAGGTLLLAIALALPLGTLAAWRMGSWLDKAVMAFSVAGFSVPVFVVGYVLIYVLALQLHWFPVQGYRRWPAASGPGCTSSSCPASPCRSPMWFLLARVTRAAVSEALTEDYIRTARAKGITELAVLAHHALRNAAVPVVTVIGVSAALLLGGVVVTETVYAIPGLGQLTVDAVLNRDFPVQGVVLFFALAYVLINLLVDLSYLVLDPRIRY